MNISYCAKTDDTDNVMSNMVMRDIHKNFLFTVYLQAITDTDFGTGVPFYLPFQKSS